MNKQIISIRPFIGASDFKISRDFYADLGFRENILFPKMSYFDMQGFGFYLQDAYVKDWIENTMLFLEVADVDAYWNELVGLDLINKYKKVKLTAPRQEPWGKECFVHDPSGILWHIGEFLKPAR